MDAETNRKLRLMRCFDLADALEEVEKITLGQGLSSDEKIRMAVDKAYSRHSTRNIERKINNARLRDPRADLKDTIYTDKRSFNREQIFELMSLNFMDQHMSVLMIGAAGSGKTWLGCAAGKQACRAEKNVLYYRTPDLLTELKESRGMSKRGKLQKKLMNTDLLILDEWLLYELDADGIMTVLDIIDRRYDNKSTIFCSQFDVGDWHKRLGGGVQADSILDRIVHNCIRIYMGEENMRARN